MLLPIISDRLIKGYVLVLSDFIRLAHPKWLSAVQVIPFMSNFFDFLGFLLRFCFFLVNIFHFWLFLIIVFVVLFIISYFLLSCFLSVEFDRESNELGMLLHKVCDSFLL